MSRIFISHSHTNNAEALALKAWLEESGWKDDVFLDVAPDRGLVPGERWQKALRDAADRCEAVACLISPGWVKSAWCLTEFMLANQLSKKILGLIIEPTPPDDIPIEMTAEWQLCDLVAGQSRCDFTVSHDPIVPTTTVSLSRSGLRILAYGLDKAGIKASSFSWPPPKEPTRAPYRGLQPLEREDAAVYFGREAAIVRALDSLRGLRQRGVERMLTILGTSGAGKSSFLRAGLLPRLIRDDRNYVPLPVIRPGRAAITGETGLIASLEGAFASRGVARSRASLRKSLGEAGALNNLLNEIRTLAQTRLLNDTSLPTVVLPIDQGEELFFAASPPASEPTPDHRTQTEAAQFLELLVEVLNPMNHTAAGSHTPYGPRHTIAILTLRSDYCERIQSFRQLSDISGWYSLPSMEAGEFKAVIEGPAARSTDAKRPLKIDPELTEALLRDAKGANALPLLAFTLERLFLEYRGDGNLRLEHYHALGGIRGCIEAVLETAFNNPLIATDAGKRDDLLRRAFFPHLIRIDPVTLRPRRRLAPWDDIPTDARPLIECLIKQRLLSMDSQSGTTVVEVAHEALIDNWKLLARCVTELHDDLRLLEKIIAEADHWIQKGRPPNLLWRHEQLIQVPAMEARLHPKLTDAQREFVRPEAHWLIEELRTADIDHYRRVEIGDRLAEIGDPRPGVGLQSDGTPYVDWVPIPSGRVKLHEESEEFDVDAFFVARYPVTWAQYHAFLKDPHGFGESQWWDGLRREERPGTQYRQIRNCPAENVSWYEAMAYCRWLTAKLGFDVRLPLETEWQQAATMGCAASIYPWGSEWIDNRANTMESRLSRSTSVGLYFAGQSRAGVFDLAGNVWEWCLNTYDRPHIANWFSRGTEARVVARGGSWKLDHFQSSAAFREHDPLFPRNRFNDLGFRVICKQPTHY